MVMIPCDIGGEEFESILEKHRVLIEKHSGKNFEKIEQL
jgi:hypothetical protein